MTPSPATTATPPGAGNDAGAPSPARQTYVLVLGGRLAAYVVGATSPPAGDWQAWEGQPPSLGSQQIGAEVAERWPELRMASWQEELRYRRERLRDLQNETD